MFGLFETNKFTVLFVYSTKGETRPNDDAGVSKVSWRLVSRTSLREKEGLENGTRQSLVITTPRLLTHVAPSKNP